MDQDNPYKAPAESITEVVVSADSEGTPSSDATGPVTVMELRVFVGPSAERYLRRWRSAIGHHGAVGIMGFHWIAALFAWLWLPYRKMFRVALFLYASLIAAVIADYEAPHNWPDSFREGMIFWPIMAVLPIICGCWANSWYLGHARQGVLNVRKGSRGIEDDPYLLRLARRGGTNIVAPFAAIICFVVFAYVLSLGIDAYHYWIGRWDAAP